MATFGATIRRGLPRRPGGEPWPPAGAAPESERVLARDMSDAAQGWQSAASEASIPQLATPEPAAARSDAAQGSQSAASEASIPQLATPEPAAAMAGARGVRRGLPRVPGGEPWPPASPAPQVHTAGSDAATPQIVTTEQPATAPDAVQVPQTAGSAAAIPQDVTPEPQRAAAVAEERAIRRGLPRTPGGEAWPPPGLFAARTAVTPAENALPVVEAAVVEAPASPISAGVGPPATPAAESVARPSAAFDVSTPLPFTRTVWEGAAARSRPAPKPEARRIGPFTRLQWAGAVIVGGAGLIYAGLMAVFAVRWLLSTQWGVDFLAAYPGEYHLPAGAPVGFPAWLGWQHFFNVFLMVLIIRSGLRVRTEKRPTAFWSPRGNGRRKISLNLWFHQSLDILWIVNGVVFVVLLFVTGQWMRIVPTSWEVFPNAVSATLQYVSLDWPTENGWVNYNSLQQLTYFATVFLAAPLAIATGARMSGIWPKNAKALNTAYPVEWARAVHFPVMIYFVLFIFVHVVLVFATGMLRNLNHMYASSDEVNWVGFWIFTASILVIAAAWVAARPLVLAPIARLFGKVSGR